MQILCRIKYKRKKVIGRREKKKNYKKGLKDKLYIFKEGFDQSNPKKFV